MIHIDDMLGVETLTPKEVAEQLMNSRLEGDEKIGEVRLECGCDLEIDVWRDIKDDPRCSGYYLYTETFALGDIRAEIGAADYYCWAKDDDGNDVLACFGC